MEHRVCFPGLSSYTLYQHSLFSETFVFPHLLVRLLILTGLIHTLIPHLPHWLLALACRSHEMGRLEREPLLLPLSPPSHPIFSR